MEREWTAEALFNYIKETYDYGKRNAFTLEDMFNLEDDRNIASDFCICYGASKLALVPKNKSIKFVLKFNAVIDESLTPDFLADYEEENGVPYIDSEWYGIYDYNYCELEWSNSKEFVNSGFRDFIAECSFIGNIGDMEVYSQERADILDNCGTCGTASEDSRKKAYDMSYDVYTYDLDDEWLAELIEWHGEDRVKEFLNLIYELGINDLHCGNIGYIDGIPVLVDYSGYE